MGRDVKRMIMMCEVKGHGISTWRVYICTSEVLVWTGIESFRFRWRDCSLNWIAI